MKNIKFLAKKYFLRYTPLRKYFVNRMPQKLHIETTTLCNFDCEYCYLKANMPEKKVMSLSDFGSLRRHFKDLEFISLSGLAEPLLNKNIVEFIKIIKKEARHCSINIVSNASLLTETLTEELVDSGLDWFDFSLDGVSSELVDSVRKGGSLNKVVNNVKTLTRVKLSKKSKTPFIKAITVLQKKNYKQLPETIKLASEIGVNIMYINSLEPYSEEVIENVLWLPGQMPDDLPDILKESIDVAKQKNITIKFAHYLPKLPYCFIAEYPFILPNGDVTGCSVLAYDRDYFVKVKGGNVIVREKGRCKRRIFGNIFEKSLEEIWFDKVYRKFRENVLRGKFPQECSSCLLKHQVICYRTGDNIRPESLIREAREVLLMNKIS